MAAPSRVTLLHSRARPRVNAERALPTALFLAALLLYLLTLTQVHTFDALSYVTTVERKPWTEVFHPHHLGYGPLGALALAIGRAVGYSGGAALPMQLLNAIAGALGVALFCSLVQRVTSRSDMALAAALLLSGAYGYWYYAVEIEVYTVAALFLLLCLKLLLDLGEGVSTRRMALLGIAQGGAVLFHQTNVLFCVPILVFWITHAGRGAQQGFVRHDGSSSRFAAGISAGKATDKGGDGRHTPPRPVLQWLAYTLALALTVGLPYLFVGIVVSGFRSWGAFEAWLTEYARTGWWGGPITAQKWADLGAGWADTLAQPGGALLGLLLIGLAVLHGRRLLRAPGPLTWSLIAWLLTYGAFFLWWEPDNIEFWIASLPPALLMLVLALRGGRRWGPEVWIALAVASTMLAVNYDAISRRGNEDRDLQRAIARSLVAQSQPADLLLIPDGLLELYLPYYEHHDNFGSLNQALFDAGGDWERACAVTRARIDTALQAGATAIVADEVLRPPTLLLERFGLRQSEIERCFAPYSNALRSLSLGSGLPVYWRLPTAQQQAESDGWHFDRFSQGWQAQNAGNQRFDGGWRFVPGSDPALTSPTLQLDARRIQAIEIRMANATHARDAQLFFAGPDGSIDESRSVRWTLAPSAAPETYRIELADTPGWRGTIVRLRIDPVGVGDGGEVQVEWVRLLMR